MLTLDTRIPPPVVALLTVAAMWLLSLALPQVAVPATPRLAVAGAIALLGLACSVAGVASFRRARTTVNPVRPETATALVTSGVYRVTRNPMYVGLLLVLIAWAVALASPVALVGPVAFIAYMNRFQIRPEEEALLRLFGPAYDTYRSSVRRWL